MLIALTLNKQDKEYLFKSIEKIKNMPSYDWNLIFTDNINFISNKSLALERFEKIINRIDQSNKNFYYFLAMIFTLIVYVSLIKYVTDKDNSFFFKKLLEYIGFLSCSIIFLIFIKLCTTSKKNVAKNPKLIEAFNIYIEYVKSNILKKIPSNIKEEKLTNVKNNKVDTRKNEEEDQD